MFTSMVGDYLRLTWLAERGQGTRRAAAPSAGGVGGRPNAEGAYGSGSAGGASLGLDPDAGVVGEGNGQDGGRIGVEALFKKRGEKAKMDEKWRN